MTNQTEHPKNILVTGGLGYLGSQLVRDLTTTARLSGCTIRILDNLQRGQYRALMNLPATGCYQFVEGDILDPTAVRLALAGVDTVIHLAAIVRTPMSFEQPQWVEQVNHWGTSHLLEACLDAGVSRFIYASSAAVYGPGGPFTESDACRPQGAYAHSKLQAEAVVQTADKRGMQTTILRLGTLFGVAPVIRFDAVANRFAFCAGVGRPLAVYGSGQQRRALVHVRSAGQSVLFCLFHPAETLGQLFNVVGENVPVQGIADMVQRLQPDVKIRYTEQDIRTHLSFEAGSGALRSLGWAPEDTLETGLTELLNQFGGFVDVTPASTDFEE